MQPVSIKKNWRGAYVVSYDCPRCGERLKSPIEDAGKRDQCPDCEAVFVVPGASERERLKTMEAHQQQQLQAAEARRLEDRERQRQEEAAAVERKAEEAKEARLARKAEFERLQLEREEAKASAPEAPPPARKKGGAITIGTVALLLFLVYPWIRNASLRRKLDSCPSSNIVAADVYYRGFVGTSEVVFDFETNQRTSVRRIDPVHLLMQFASKCDTYHVRRFILARDGEEVFQITTPRLKELASSYSNGGEIWAFNNLPSSVYRMSGAQAYSTWEGGWLGVLQKQTDDLNTMISEWLEE